MKKLFVSGDILLPKDADMRLWSVIACDQFTSQPEYWDLVDTKVGDAPSTLRLILPEAYLGSKDNEKETEKINAEMEKYLSEGVFKTISNSFIYVERSLTVGHTRRGLLGLIDLETYDYHKNSSSPVRATEGTVEDRLPPRVRVREGASLELPHIVVFIDDPENTVIDAAKGGELLYDFELMDGGGRIKGSRIFGENADKVSEALSALSEPSYLEKRYKLEGKKPVIIAMGDGNHSLATARLCWEKIKQELSPEERENHPARYGLAELVNIHDPSVIFEPIHRVMFKTETEDFFETAKDFFKVKNKDGQGCHEIRCLCGDKSETISLCGLTIGQAIAAAQEFCLFYIEKHGGELDYIHDDDSAIEMSQNKGCCGLLLPSMDKNELFPSIIKSGVFPAKSFSIGPARDKRYYLECRKIK
ncbi:MAG: DUF1015 domain-containing protein [Clostridiales bacterium]|nr:DUF1015 domain-containing protein [Clostridiales bacterium]